MSRPINDSPYLYGLHDPGGEHIMTESGIPGWVLFTEEIGHLPGDQRGVDYGRWANQGFGIMARLNNGYEPNGTIPTSDLYHVFAQRCANFVRNSRGCHIWIIGNEMNFAVERPGVRYDGSTNPPRLKHPGEVILPAMYADCYGRCRRAIKSLNGHEHDQVIVGATAPWNPQTTYEGNENGDWVKYQEDILKILGPDDCDGISIHAYTHGRDPRLIYTDAFMNPPFRHRQYNFRAYQDFMRAIPIGMRNLPVYLTETDQDDAWHNANSGWVQRVYGEIDWWNRQPGTQVIRAVILYRWPNVDKWGIDGKAGVIDDFRHAMSYKYNWETVLKNKPAVEPEPVTPEPTVVDTSPITFPSTGKTAKGLFAAFYRKHGVEITGYPLSEEYLDATSNLRTQLWQRMSLEEQDGAIRVRAIGQELLSLRERVSELERRIVRLQAGGGSAPKIVDIVAQLPRESDRYIRRTAEDIKYVVINHTGVRPEVGADRVAQAHARKWPGILGQFFITADGTIEQTNPIDEVVEREQPWIFNGVNIYVAGNFDETVPNEVQLEALAHLCAWLLSEYHLPETSLRGVTEFIVTRSPGLQWLNGQQWKQMLLERIRAVPIAPTPAPADNAELEELRARVADLQAQLTAAETALAAAQAERDRLSAQLETLLQRGDGSKLTQPAITDVSLQLPRTAGSLKQRSMDAVQFVVINHTAVDASIAVERLAAAHQRRWGSILYQYVIMGDGTILQTNALEDVVDLSQSWIVNGINVALAGNFTESPPPEAQVQATAALCAWLMQEHAIPIDNIRGASEFISTQSPGSQWLNGSRWKETLLAEISAVQGDDSALSQLLSATDNATIDTLRAQLAQMQAALSQANDELSALEQERDSLLEERNRLLDQLLELPNNTELEERIAILTKQVETLSAEKSKLAQQVLSITAENTKLSEQLAAAAADKAALTRRINDLETRIAQLQEGMRSEPRTVAPPAIIDIVDKLAKHSTEHYELRTLDKITHIAIHHSAAPPDITPERIAQYHVNKGWPGMGYHYYVLPDGLIYQTNRLETVSFHVHKQNHYAIGISVAGNFMNGATPTPKQLEVVSQLVAWLTQKLNVPLANVIGHKEFPENATACPGSDWITGARWKEQLLARARAMLEGQHTLASKTIGHYVLFWQSADNWAKDDWAAAANYIARFRPTAGFAPEDAMSAEYVTIVGGVGGVTPEVEQMLVAAGCQVERVAGASAADTQRVLDELADAGKRFRTFDV